MALPKSTELVPRSENRVGLLLSVSSNYSFLTAETMNWELLQKKYGYILRRFLERYVLPKQGNGRGRRYEDRFGFRRGKYAQILPWVSLLYFYFVTVFLQVPTKPSKEKQKHSNLNLKLEQQRVWGS